MKILLVNDDGYKSDTLRFAYDTLCAYGEVLVVAPLEQQSGKSVSITIGDIPFQQLNDYWYAVEGTPADCVTFAIYGLKYAPDIVVSGINKGFNIGVDTMYSGTVGAALQANYHGFKAMAFSGDYMGSNNIKKYFKSTFEYILTNKLLSKDFVLNINLPQEKFDLAKGIRHTDLHFVKTILKGEVESGVFKSTRQVIKSDLPEHSDVYAYKQGYISISKLKLN